MKTSRGKEQHQAEQEGQSSLCRGQKHNLERMKVGERRNKQKRETKRLPNLAEAKELK